MSGQVSEIALVECLLGPTHLVFILNNYFSQHMKLLLWLPSALFYERVCVESDVSVRDSRSVDIWRGSHRCFFMAMFHCLLLLLEARAGGLPPLNG